jgi:hypothetical protein
MIAPDNARGKSFLAAQKSLENAAKQRIDDHEVVKPSHNNAQFRSIAGHAELG